MTPITVFVESCHYAGNDKYNLLLDFYAPEDLTEFISQSGMEMSTHDASIIEIKGYHSERPLRADTYYDLNVKLLRLAKINEYSPESHPVAILATYEFDDNYGGEYIPLLFPHSPLRSHRTVQYRNVEFRDRRYCLIDDVPWQAERNPGPMSLRVNNVGQGNWNEILCDGRVAAVFDIGTDTHANKFDIQKLLDARLPDYTQASHDKNRPVLVLSHWDLDHYICLKEMSIEQIRDSFSAFVFPDKYSGVTAKEICEKMNVALGNRCCPVPMHEKTTAPVSEAMHSVFGLFNWHLYGGENNHNRNRSGLILVVQGPNKSACLTGDCLLRQAEYVMNKSQYAGDNVLIVPHHGGKYESTFRHYDLVKAQCDRAVISVGPNNSYGHPEESTIRYLSRKFNNSVGRTDAQQPNVPIIENL